ncbi:MAG: gliding motility-associated ABC transporter ATP-binding subunit GldA [Bacteroidetes bacterium]|nr:gliding motility-associated ABC transporter ATP-binding subunit GldA [Bacteroidota bacterium]
MGIVIDHLTKVFGQQKAVNDVSFEAGNNEILGFLGPNGAGKSTVMKMITCYLSPSGGRVVVNGFDVMEQAYKVRQITGYLPENNPLYHDQYIHEYLWFIGKLSGMKGSALKARIKEMIRICGIEKEQNKLIGALSKGYRQRVGLAQALIHDPDVLVLDEPTTGLDPNQIVEVRNLIKEISASKTVILSTHIMQEVESICDRVVIINEGRIVADSTVKDLRSKSESASKIRIQLSGNIEHKLLHAITGVSGVEALQESRWIIAYENEDIRPALTRLIAKQGLDLLELNKVEDTLEDIFRQLTHIEKSQ